MTEKIQPSKVAEDQVKKAIQDQYGALARSGAAGQRAAQQIAEAFGYSAEELAGIPAEANLGVSCGNPTALASLRPGEVVVDLGSGAGLDIFLAAQKVGPTGKAIGIDMTKDMIERARCNAQEAGLTNVEFHLAEIESLPLPDRSVDCVISNCVLNLVPDKPKAFAEIFRVLKPGGRLAMTDLALKQPLPPALAADLGAYVGCVAGAMQIDDYGQALADAGFEAVQILDTKKDLSIYADLAGLADMCQPSGCSASTLEATQSFQKLAEWLQRIDINDYAASVLILAVKPQHAPNP